MSRACSNQLTIEQLPDGRYRLFGYVQTEENDWEATKIRTQGRDLAALEARKTELEDAAARYLDGVTSQMRAVRTRLTDDQIQDAESAVRKLRAGRSLEECVVFANQVLGDGKAVAAADALRRWIEEMERLKYSPATMRDNRNRTLAFFLFVETGKVDRLQGRPADAEQRFKDDLKKISLSLQEFSNDDVKKFVSRGGGKRADYTQIGDAKVLTAFFNFCVAEKMLNTSPVEIDLKTMKDRATESNAGKQILTPAQAQRLLDAACNLYDGVMVPFVLLTTWTFIRPSEAERITDADIVEQRGKTILHLRGRKLGSRWRDPEVPANVAPLLWKFVRAGHLANGAFKSERMWLRIREEAGLLKLNPMAPETGGLRTIVPGSSIWHADMLRHTGMSYRYQQLINSGSKKHEAEADVTSEAGNSVRVAFAHYLRRASPDACDMFFKIKADCTPQNRAKVVAIESGQTA